MTTIDGKGRKLRTGSFAYSPWRWRNSGARAKLSHEQRSVLHELVCAAYMLGGRLPADDRELAEWADLPINRWREIGRDALRAGGFRLAGAFYVNPELVARWAPRKPKGRVAPIGVRRDEALRRVVDTEEARAEIAAYRSILGLAQRQEAGLANLEAIHRSNAAGRTRAERERVYRAIFARETPFARWCLDNGKVDLPYLLRPGAAGAIDGILDEVHSREPRVEREQISNANEIVMPNNDGASALGHIRAMCEQNLGPKARSFSMLMNIAIAELRDDRLLIAVPSDASRQLLSSYVKMMTIEAAALGISSVSVSWQEID